MSENSQNRVENNNSIKTSQNNASGNRNKYFAFILTAVIIGGLLWNPTISDVGTGLYSDGHKNNYGYGCKYEWKKGYEKELRNEEKEALPYVTKYAKNYGVSPALIMAIIRQESDFKPGATNSKSTAVGCMGVTYLAAKDAGYKGSRKKWVKEDGKDPDTNIKYGTKYLTILYARHAKNQSWRVYDDPLKDIISAYKNGYPIKENEWYVNEVINGRNQRGYKFFSQLVTCTCK